MELTSTQEDYIEIVFRLIQERKEGVRVSDLAEQLGCRMPTVTRTVQYLTEHGYFDHPHRKLITLTEKGAKVAEEIAHRHDDVVDFLHLVLGVPSVEAESDACVLEHGFSPLAAERLHRFLLYFEQLPVSERKRLQAFVTDQNEVSFSLLNRPKTSGRRH